MGATARTYSRQERRSLVREWKGSTLKQEVFAAQHGISLRTLRCWIPRYSPTTPPLEQVLKGIGDAQCALERIRQSLEAGEPENLSGRVPAMIAPTPQPAAAAPPAATVKTGRFFFDD